MAFVKRPRTLPVRVAPVLGESFASYVERIAFHLNVPTLTLLARTGLADTESFRDVPLGYGTLLEPSRLNAFSYAGRVEVSEIRKMLLSHYDGVCCELAGADPRSPRSLNVLQKQWIYSVGSHVCPDCVTESGGAWQLRWKLPWSFACVRHRCLLIDTCSGCHRRLAQGSMNKQAPISPSHVPDTFVCRNPRPGGGRSRWEKPCLFPIRDLKRVSLEGWTHLLEAQHTLDSTLSAERLVTVEDKSLARIFFTDMRALCILILTWGEPEDLGEVPAYVQGEFADYVNMRKRAKDALISGVLQQEGRAKELRHHNVPQSAALMAAIAPVALRALISSSSEALASVIEPFVLRRREHCVQLYRLPRGASPRLREAYEICIQPTQTFAWRVGIHSNRRKAAFPNLTPDHVPQLLWEREYEELFADLISGAGTFRGRWFCSATLVQLCGSYNWDDAAAEIGVPGNWLVPSAKVIMTNISRSGKTHIFRERIHALAERTAADADAIDYGSRRRLLADLVEIDRGYWEERCSSLRYRGEEAELQRRNFAATWVWGESTQGHYRLSPWFRHHDNILIRERYKGFLRCTLYQKQDLRQQVLSYPAVRWRGNFPNGFAARQDASGFTKQPK